MAFDGFPNGDLQLQQRICFSKYRLPHSSSDETAARNFLYDEGDFRRRWDRICHAVEYTELPSSGRNPAQTVNFWASHALARVHAPLP
jgi:hypothetical protein